MKEINIDIKQREKVIKLKEDFFKEYEVLEDKYMGQIRDTLGIGDNTGGSMPNVAKEFWTKNGFFTLLVERKDGVEKYSFNVMMFPDHVLKILAEIRAKVVRELGGEDRFLEINPNTPEGKKQLAEVQERTKKGLCPVHGEDCPDKDKKKEKEVVGEA